MSEYLKIEATPTGDPNVMVFHTNFRLAEEEVEHYLSTQEMEEGSAVAQVLAPIEGIKYIRIEASTLEVTKYDDIPWHTIAADINATLKEFFL
ncbi:MAG: NifU N-terminal domain-containing protein [Chloroflexota bacterium]